MGELLPTIAAQSIRDGLLEYLETTFSLSDASARLALRELLADPEKGIFSGPYLRLRLPFQPAADGWRDTLGWHPLDDGQGFAPYGHQAQAFARLSSLHLTEERRRPQPTLVTTGTGSGKTEAFLYPILDHVLRAKRDGMKGCKALLLYPMNALATDQAQRLAELIVGCPTLSGVTAGLYTGQAGPSSTKVTAKGLITDRYVMRSQAPDILLTNYKMLDQLLLREADARIWKQSAASLQYLVLDEFHTYDGAQGTDVAMLLRRLALTLKEHDSTWEAAAGGRPLGRITPVATSATLGDRGDPAAMLGFAQTVFGEEFGEEAVITESRVSLSQWVVEGPPADLAWRVVDGRELVGRVGTRLTELGSDPEPEELADAVVAELYDGAPSSTDRIERVRAHPLTRRLIDACEQAADTRRLAAALMPDAPVADAERCLMAFAGLLSHLRVPPGGRGMPSVELHLWIREVTRVDREASPRPELSFSDDGALAGTAMAEAGEPPTAPRFPAVFCRHCGRSGWGVSLSPAGDAELDTSDTNIRRDHLNGEGRFRALLHATAEGEEALRAADGEPPAETLRWLYVQNRQLLRRAPTGEAAQDGSVLPVLIHVGTDAPDHSRRDTCPACLQPDGIRFLGSAVATLLSVALSTLFGATNLDVREKKTLVFTDSVQDAAHRAGFVQARSHSLTVRSILREAVGDGARSLDELADRAIAAAGDDQTMRYRILPPDQAAKPEFSPFWQRTTLAKVPAGVRRRVRARLAFDATLEFGLQSRLGRTLELTGTLAAEVQASPGAMLSAARWALAEAGGQMTLDETPSDEAMLAWVRGVLERMRERGAIEHPWLRKLIAADGNRYFVWRGRPRSEGMPAFPLGRTAPNFPRVGSAAAPASTVFDTATHRQGWYAQWTRRALHVDASAAATLVRLLLARLAHHEVLIVTRTDSGADVYGIAATAVTVEPIADAALSAGERLLVCDVCQSPVPGTATVVSQLDGAPCVVTRCEGRLRRASGAPANFYRRFFRSREVQRIVAREHTSLLEPKLLHAHEEGFKGRVTRPDAPNVLVATPTLELGIDIGDLSTVMLASLPRSVAAYLQRVGRAGRLTGSALNLAFVSGRADQLPQLGEPTSMINGVVRPPATYLDAVEILRRQFIASLGDREARRADGVHPGSASAALGTVDPESYLHTLATGAEGDRGHLHAFLAGFPSLGESARAALIEWATPVAGELTSPLAERMLAEAQRHRQQVETLGHRITEIKQVLPGLEQVAQSPAAADEDRAALRIAQASLKLAQGQLNDLKNGYWIGALELVGLLPNYTLLDEDVTLEVGLSWLDPDTGAYETDADTFHRSGASALSELAPGATFYANGHQLKVNAVDLGNQGEAVRAWALCPGCGHSADVTESPAPTVCPRCERQGIGEAAQRVDVVELTRVSSTMRRDEATIGDDRDDRIRERYAQIALADFAPEDVSREWWVKDVDLGVKHVRALRLRWLNLGRANAPGAPRLIAGHEVSSELFRLCAECGQLDTHANSNSRYDHRPWCSLRDATSETNREVALARILDTEGLLLRLPPFTSLGSSFAVPSLAAAVKLGLREHLGGAPDHLAMETVVDPVPQTVGDHASLLIHDLVPGGTGYLSELAEPEVLRDVLHAALDVVTDCPCAEDDRLACPRCLLPFARPGQTQLVSRAAAEGQLRQILFTDADADGETVPSDADWTITESPSQQFNPESVLEQKFRAVLHERLTTMGATIKVVPQTSGERWELTTGGRRWQLVPQVLISGCKPDFVLRCSDPAVPSVAIFCDGKLFHASYQHNNLADDATKRRVLREEGMLVLSLTWNDLEQPTSGPPAWFNAAAAQVVMATDGLGLKPAHLDLVCHGPLDLLVSWIASPDPAGLRAIGQALPFLMAPASSHGKVAPEKSLLWAARTFLEGDDAFSVEAGDGAPVTSAWAWQQGAVVALARLGADPTHTEIAVVLNDSASAVADGLDDAWREWLRLGNLLGLREIGSEWTVSSLVSADEPVGVDDEVIEFLPSEWEELAAHATPAERELLAALAEHGVAVPEFGPEIEGIPLGLSWMHEKVTLREDDLTDEEAVALRANGWTVVERDAEQIHEALQTVRS